MSVFWFRGVGAVAIGIVLIAGGLAGVVGLRKQSIADIVTAGDDPAAGLGLCEDIAGGVVCIARDLQFRRDLLDPQAAAVVDIDVFHVVAIDHPLEIAHGIVFTAFQQRALAAGLFAAIFFVVAEAGGQATAIGVGEDIADQVVGVRLLECIGAIADGLGGLLVQRIVGIGL